MDWELFIRDDGSSDNTRNLLEGYREKDKNRITIIEDNKKHLGPKRSFEQLLQKSEADYFMFCDQDDHWLPDKIKKTLAKMKELEQRYPDIPAMVFSDLTVVDKMLREVHPSFWEFIKVDPDNVFNIYRLLINNPVVGCTVMINKRVKSLVLPFPEQAVMHDWWIALNVAQKGVVDYLSQPTILYRLHEKNSIGAALTDRKYYAGRVAYLSKTISQNGNALKMLRALDFPLSQIKYMGYKIVITYSKLF
jgi:glycosyltransferase involved in cell wall biosynthesis